MPVGRSHDREKGASKTHQISAAFVQARKHFKAGDLAAADTIAVKILGADPMHVDALHLRGLVAAGRGNATGAIALMKRVVELNPGHAGAHCDLGPLLMAQGRLQEAAGHLRDALKAEPKKADAHLHLGILFKDQGRQIEAVKSFRTALRHRPGWLAAQTNLCFCQVTMGQVDDALKTARSATKAHPKSAISHSRLGMVLDKKGEYEGSVRAHETAIELDPENAAFRLDFVDSLSAHGNTSGALAVCRGILARSPDHVGAFARIARLKKFVDAGDPDIVAMEAISARPDISSEGRRSLHFSLGKAYEDCGVFERAFAEFRDGNRKTRQGYSYRKQTTDALFDDLTRAYTPETMAQLAGNGSDAQPIFIVGMPRSGTSLVEQILASHPDVDGAGELGAMNEVAAMLTAQTGARTHRAGLDETGARQLTAWGEHYRAQATAFSRHGSRIADKMPSNYLYIGLIMLIFPKASIVHCRRDAADTCLSIYKTSFSKGNLPYGYDLDELAHVYRHYQDLMRHWHRLFPGVIHDLDYASLVSGGEAEMRKLLSKCELDWSEAVLRFNAVAHPMHTASVAQVRQPLHKRSLGLAGRYGAAADPLFAALKAAGVQN